MERTGANLHVVGLQHDTALRRPKLLQCQDHVLERARRVQVVEALLMLCDGVAEGVFFDFLDMVRIHVGHCRRL